MATRDEEGGFYHLHVKNIGRRFGRSVVAAAAYRAGETLWNEAEERESVFAGRRDVLHAEIRLPAGAPAWAGVRDTLWNAVEAAEKRKDARLAKEIEFALPRELSQPQWVAVVREMADAYAQEGFVVDLAIHEDGRGHNPHAHLLLTLRDLGPEGFGAKLRQADAKSFVVGARRRWERLANAALGKAGSSVQIDARSYRTRGIARTPGVHRGPDQEARRDGREVAAAVRAMTMTRAEDGAALRAMLQDGAHERYQLLHRRDDWPPIYREPPIDLSSAERPEFIAYWQEIDRRVEEGREVAVPERELPPIRQRALADDPDRLAVREAARESVRDFETEPLSGRALAQVQDLERRLQGFMASRGYTPSADRDWVAWQEGFDAFRAQIAELRELEADIALFRLREQERTQRAERHLPVPDREGRLVPAEREAAAPAPEHDPLAWAREATPAAERPEDTRTRDPLDWIPGRQRVPEEPVQEPERDRER
jgi:hypothetical protein